MDLLWSIAVAVLLILAGGAWMVMHWRSLRVADAAELPLAELDFARRQYRRRMQTSGMLVCIGAGVLAGALLREPWWLFVAIWIVVVLVTLWVVLLALADIVSTRIHFGRLRDHYIVERAKLEAQARRLRAERANGQPEK